MHQYILKYMYDMPSGAGGGGLSDLMGERFR